MDLVLRLHQLPYFLLKLKALHRRRQSVFDQQFQLARNPLPLSVTHEYVIFVPDVVDLLPRMVTIFALHIKMHH